MLSLKPETVFPALVSIIFYLVVFFLAEFSRKTLDYFVKKNTRLYVFLIELIGTVQMCTCIYENSIIVKYYGVVGFFLTVVSLLVIGGLINRGAYVSPLAPIELFLRGKLNSEKFMSIILAQTIGGFAAFRCANSLWYYSTAYSNDHFSLYKQLPCSIVYKVSFIYVFIFEIFGAFLLRLILHRLPDAYKQYLAPITVSTFLSFALAYIGVPGLNPVTASSRLQGCPGLDLQWFIMLYWCCPVVGWLIGAQFDSKRKIRPAKSNNKNKQVEEIPPKNAKTTKNNKKID